MSSRILSASSRALRAGSPFIARRTANLHTTPIRMDAATALPARRPVGAFRGGLFGFLLGSTLAGAGVYSYLLQEYKASNDLLTEDIYALQSAVQRIATYLQAVEEHMDTLEKKKK